MSLPTVLARPVLARLRSPAALLAACTCVLACGDPGAAASQRGSEASAERGRAEVYQALEAGLPDAARTLLDQYGEVLGVDAYLLRARAALMERDGVAALRELEAARRGAPRDPRVLALEVEILVSLDRIPAAREKLLEAWKEVGQAACLERARGMLLLRTQGGGAEGLKALEHALELEPDLLFVGYPMAQARLLVAREAMTRRAFDEALAQIRAAREYDPFDPDFRELEAEIHAARLDFPAALELYAGLAEEGVELGDTRAILQQRYGTFLLAKSRRADAIEAYAAARALGLDDEGLGFGATVLAEEALKRIDAGVAYFEGDQLAGARAEFEAALTFDPANLEARHHLGACLFTAGEYARAAEMWDGLLSVAEAESVAFPEPVHLFLARAWHGAGEPDRAMGVLVRYVEREPQGPWIEDTRELLAALEAERILGIRR